MGEEMESVVVEDPTGRKWTITGTGEELEEQVAEKKGRTGKIIKKTEPSPPSSPSRGGGSAPEPKSDYVYTTTETGGVEKHEATPRVKKLLKEEDKKLYETYEAARKETKKGKVFVAETKEGKPKQVSAYTEEGKRIELKGKQAEEAGEIILTPETKTKIEVEEKPKKELITVGAIPEKKEKKKAIKKEKKEKEKTAGWRAAKLRRQRIAAAVKKYEQAAPLEKAAMHGHTFFSEKGYEYIGTWLPFTSKSPETVVKGKVAEIAAMSKETEEWYPLTSAVSAPTFEIGVSMAGGVAVGAAAATTTGAKILGTTAGKIGAAGLGAAGLGLRYGQMYEEAKKGKPEKVLGMGIVTSADIAAGAWAAQKTFKEQIEKKPRKYKVEKFMGMKKEKGLYAKKEKPSMTIKEKLSTKKIEGRTFTPEEISRIKKFSLTTRTKGKGHVTRYEVYEPHIMTEISTKKPPTEKIIHLRGQRGIVVSRGYGQKGKVVSMGRTTQELLYPYKPEPPTLNQQYKPTGKTPKTSWSKHFGKPTEQISKDVSAGMKRIFAGVKPPTTKQSYKPVVLSVTEVPKPKQIPTTLIIPPTKEVPKPKIKEKPKVKEEPVKFPEGKQFPIKEEKWKTFTSPKFKLEEKEKILPKQKVETKTYKFPKTFSPKKKKEKPKPKTKPIIKPKPKPITKPKPKPITKPKPKPITKPKFEEITQLKYKYPPGKYTPPVGFSFPTPKPYRKFSKIRKFEMRKPKVSISKIRKEEPIDMKEFVLKIPKQRGVITVPKMRVWEWIGEKKKKKKKKKKWRWVI